MANPSTAGQKEGFLVHGLIGTAALEALRAVGCEQQQRNRALVGLHQGRQQVGHG
jgi:hypothetical protein